MLRSVAASQKAAPKAPALVAPARKNGAVAAITVYPANDDLRKRIMDAGKDHGSASSFLLHLFRQWERGQAVQQRVG